jgi:hypothetical protein
MKQFSFLLFFTIAVLVTHAQTVTTWQGPSTGGSWTDAANWDNGVPTAAATEIIFDGSLSTLTSGVITITDVQQTNANFSYDKLRVINNATVTLSSSSATYLYLDVSADIEAGSRLNVGAGTGNLFIVGGTLSTIFNIDGTLDLQGQGIGNSTRTAFEPTTSFFGTALTTIRGTLIMSGKVAVISQSTASNFIVENGGTLNITRDGGTVPNGNYKDGSLIKVEGVVNTGTGFVAATYNGVIEWNCPGQTVSGASAILLPASSFNTIDSLVINNTGSGKSVRLATNPAGYYVKNIIVNSGTLEFGSPTGSGIYTAKVDNITQNGGILIGNAPGVTGFDNAFAPDTISVTGSFIQNGGTFDFSTRTPNNSTPDASCVLQVAGNVKIGGTVKLSQAATAKACALVFNGNSTQNFEITNTGVFINKIKTVLNNTSPVTGVNAISNITVPDSLVFKLGYFFLNNFNLTNPLPVLPVTNPFQTHVVTNGAGFFIQKKVKLAAVGIPIGASTTSVNPLIIGLTSVDSLDIAAKVDIGIAPAIAFPARAVNRTWSIKPLGILPSNLAISFGYSDLTPFPGDGNPLFSYTANDEVGLYAGTNWQVVSLPGGIAPAGTNPYAISYVIPGALLLPNIATPLVISNVASVVSVSNIINLSVAGSNNSALLKWDIKELTSAISRFEILRSTDGRSFTPVTSVTPVQGQLYYSLTDNNLQQGVNYYRIKMYDVNGSFKYSVIVAVINKEKGIVITRVLPNLVNNEATVMISSAAKTPVQLIVTDMMGRMVYKTNTQLNAGSNQLNIDCNRLAAGTYQLTGYSPGEQVNTIRFIKQ